MHGRCLIWKQIPRYYHPSRTLSLHITVNTGKFVGFPICTSFYSGTHNGFYGALVGSAETASGSAAARAYPPFQLASTYLAPNLHCLYHPCMGSIPIFSASSAAATRQQPHATIRTKALRDIVACQQHPAMLPTVSVCNVEIENERV